MDVKSEVADVWLHFKEKVTDVFSLFDLMPYNLQVTAVQHVSSYVNQWKDNHVYRNEIGTQTTETTERTDLTQDATVPTHHDVDSVQNTNNDLEQTAQLIISPPSQKLCEDPMSLELPSGREENEDSAIIRGELANNERSSDAETEIYDSLDNDPESESEQRTPPVPSAPAVRSRRRAKKCSRNKKTGRMRTPKKPPTNNTTIAKQKILANLPKDTTLTALKETIPEKNGKNKKAKRTEKPKTAKPPEGSSMKEEQQRTCHLCERVLSSAQVLQQHLRIHSGEMPYTCPEPDCGRTFRQSSALHVHQKKAHSAHKPFTCDQCDFSAHFKFELSSHVQRFHIKARDFLCSNCGKGFISKQCLRIHEQGHFGKRFHCPKCDFVTHTPPSLEAHIRNTHAAHKKFVCEICGSNMKYQSSYLTHMRKHYGVKPYKCPLCVATFSTSSQQKAHLRRVHEPSNLECDVCRKKFADRHNLERHKVIHREVKPFSCPQCSHTSNYQCNLRKHCLSKHQLAYPPKVWAKVKQISDIDITGNNFYNKPDTGVIIESASAAAGETLSGPVFILDGKERGPMPVPELESHTQGNYVEGDFTAMLNS